jgi:aspartyl-tRNA(Asn)/glutamyl-tRNA(Gln) amidotransferase subunit A
LGVKDILAMAEGPTTAQSLILDRSWGAGKDAPTVARVKAAGAVITGKTTTMEFACGIPDATKPFPIPRNPWNLDTWAGGSSSGTGSGVAAGRFLAGLGTDTAGSIRIPAAFCGVSGLMPTFGRVPKSGCVPLGYSLDHVGPMARSARDCAAVLEVLAGLHESDPDCVDAPFTAPEFTGDLSGMRIGVVREHHFPEHSDPALGNTFDAAIAVLTEQGATVVEVTLPYWQEMITADVITMCCEALAYHRTDLTGRWQDDARDDGDRCDGLGCGLRAGATRPARRAGRARAAVRHRRRDRVPDGGGRRAEIRGDDRPGRAGRPRRDVLGDPHAVLG